jgi:ABC-type glycerol-3-phosphate transport system substrate-binding protein
MKRLPARQISRSVALSLTAVLALSACSAGSGPSDGSVESIKVLSRWASGTAEAAYQQQVIDKFTEGTGIEVEVVDGLETIDDQYETAIAAGQEPDVVIVNLFDKTLGWLDAGVIKPTDQYLKDWGLADKIDEAALTQWRQGQKPDGQLQGIPYSGFSWPVWYNAKLLKDAGVTEVPKTTEELIAAARKLRAKGIAPMIVGGNDWSGQKLFYQITQSYLTPDATKKIMSDGGYCSSPEMMKGIELFTELRDGGVFVDNVQGFTADNMNNTYYSQKAAMMPAGSWAFAGAVEAGTGVVENTTLGGFPVPEDAVADGPTAYKGYTGVGFMISNKGAEEGRIEAVRKFVEAFYADEAVGEFVTTANNLAPVKGDYSSYAKNPLLAQALALDGKVGELVLPDVWIGSSSDPITQVTALAYGNADAQAICSGLDNATK